MAKYVVINIPAYGHVNPTLAVVQELVRRGDKVVYYLTEEFRAAVEATGATFRPYQSFMSRPMGPGGPSLSGGGEARYGRSGESAGGAPPGEHLANARARPRGSARLYLL